MILHISDSALSTTLGLGTTIASDNGFLDEYSTTVCCLTSSLSSSPINPNEYYLHSTNNYINSLSNEEIVMLEEKLAQKQDTITVGDKEFTIDQVANLTAINHPQQTTKPQVKTEKPKTYKKI